MNMNNRQCVLAIDAGGTFFKSALIDLQGNVILESVLSEPVASGGSAEGVKNCYQQILKKQLALAGEINITVISVGIDTPGPFDYEGGISKMTHKFQSIYNIPLRPWITEIIGELPITFVHDATAFMLGEAWKGAAQGYKNAIGVMLGTGLGFACMQDFGVQITAAGGPAISIYNRPFKESIAEDYVSRRGIIARYKARVPNALADIDVYHIARLEEAGDKAALETLVETGALLGEILTEPLLQIEPECLVLGGQISKSFDLFLAPLQKALAGVPSLKMIAPTPIVQYGHLIGAAAGSFILQKYLPDGLDSRISIIRRT